MRIIQLSILIMGIALFLTSCKKSDDSQYPSNVTTSSWKVSYFYESGKDETYKFSSYTFDFKDDGSLVATNPSGSYSGTWVIASRFNIDFGLVDPLQDLNDDWVIVENNNSSIKLKDDNLSKIEELHFSKI